MSIAEKLVTIAENQEKIYNAGGLAQHPKKTVSGEFLSINDVVPFEHALKVRTSSINILNADGMLNNEFTKNDNGSYTFTKTDSTQRFSKLADIYIPANTQVCFSVGRYDGEALEIGIQTLDINGVYYISYSVSSTKKYIVFTPTADIIGIRLYYNQNITNGISTILEDIQINIGKTIQPYTPYVDISTVKLDVLGNNLVNNDTSLITSVFFISETGAETTRFGYEISLPIGTYTIRAIQKASFEGYAYLYGCLKGENNIRKKLVKLVTDGAINSPITFTIEKGDVLILYNGIGNESLKTTQDLFSRVDIQLVVGETVTSYEQYIEPTIYTPNADGTVEGVKSIYPTTNIFVNTKGVLIEVEYHQNGIDAGKQAEYDRFWDIFQQNGNRTNYTQAFCYGGWNDEIFKPKYPIRIVSGNNLFANNTLITNIDADIDLTLSNRSQYFALFGGCTKLKRIRKIMVNETATYTASNGTFYSCAQLEDITFEGTIGRNIDFQYSPLLSRVSIENIIGCLSATETGRTLTLSQTAVDNAFTTDEWNALIADKTNWTFSLV